MKSVPSSTNFPKLEEQILHYWKKNSIFKKSLKKNQGAAPYIFYDGPPFATGLPHYGHILTSYIKDTIPRYFTMKGMFVDRRWGWDCHGLPIEYEVEKALNVNGKTEIEKFGIENFNKKCSDIVLQYADEWIDIIHRIGRWVDFDRQYKTMDLSYMESVIWVFSELFRNNLIYESQKVVAYCNRCQTPLSNFETGLDDSYRKKEDPAITVKLKDRDDPNIHYLIWTTTPWTLPSNKALAVNPEIHYSLLELDTNECVWLATDRIDHYQKFLPKFSIISSVTGSELVGKRYVPLFEFVNDPNAFQIIKGDFVETSIGTGIVHLAPTFGEDDYNICQENDIVGFDPISPDGKFTEAADDLHGMNLVEANTVIINQLKQNKHLMVRENYAHNYPHCWRCDSPLIYRAISSWYVKVTDVKDNMVVANKEINWIPDHIRLGRFGQWLEGARDWAVSRNRFWGAPIPVWKCSECSEVFVPSSIKALEEKSEKPVKDLHRPYCDHIIWACEKEDCKGTFKRVEEVLDCWFESGAMPYAQVHFPFENKEWFEENFPASFIVEYIAQTRGWFYTLVVESAALFRKHPFKNAICHGVILADDGRKMSKSLKNFPDPMKIICEHGSDALRIYLMSSSVVRGLDIRFSENSVREAVRRYLIPLWNTFHFFTSYAELAKGYEPHLIDTAKRLEDRYILSELESLRLEVTKAVESYDLPKCYQKILYFIETLSGWYIRINRSRFWVTEIDDDSQEAFDTLYTVLLETSIICAPFMPFTMEYIHNHFTDKSVHLCDWPVEKPFRMDPMLNEEVRQVRGLIEGGRRIREKNRTALRQPLPLIRVSGIHEKTLKAYDNLIKDQLNIKQILSYESPDMFAERDIKLNVKVLGPLLKKDLKTAISDVNDGKYELLSNMDLKVGQHKIERKNYTLNWLSAHEKEDAWSDNEIILSLSFEISQELKIEGTARDLNRIIQDLRKKIQLSYDTTITLNIQADGQWEEAVNIHGKWLAEQTLAKNLTDKVTDAMFEKTDERGFLKIDIKPIDR